MASRSRHLLKDFQHIKPIVSRQDVNAVTRQLRECAARCPVSADLLMTSSFFFISVQRQALRSWPPPCSLFT
ncbi:TPA: hypothetical protein ACS1EX_001651, partial [Klebsiella oxytoca]